MASAARALGSKPSGSTPPREPRQCQRFTWPVAYRMVWFRRNSQFSADNAAGPKGRNSPAMAWKRHRAGQAKHGVVEKWSGRGLELSGRRLRPECALLLVALIFE